MPTAYHALPQNDTLHHNGNDSQETLLSLSSPTADKLEHGDHDDHHHPPQPTRDCEDRVISALKLVVAASSLLFVLYATCCLVVRTTAAGDGAAASSSWKLLPWSDSFHRWHHPDSAPAPQSDDGITFGLGMGDVTGPIVEVNMMGYASMPQTNEGLHIRLRSRAFTVGSRATEFDTGAAAGKSASQLLATADGSPTRWIFINSDICMGDTAIRRGVVDRLRELYPGLYGERNIAFVGTHSHAGPGGFITALLPTLTSKGVVRQNVDAIIDGTVQAAVRSHEDFERRLREGTRTRLSFGRKRLPEAHIQRSRYAYDQNPQEERDRYGDDDLDHDFSLLRFEDLSTDAATTDDAESRGFLSWYAVHGTSLYENNTLTSADNKGLAALLYETAQQPEAMPGQGSFIAGFSQSTVGDTSPNTQGAWCDDGSVCEFKHSTCDNGHGKERVQTCHGRGPAWGDAALLDVSPTGSWDFASNEMIARLQVDAAREIMERQKEQEATVAADGGVADEAENNDDLYRSLTVLDDRGPVSSVKMNIDMSRYTFHRSDGSKVTTCPAALGYGFAGGTTDGPGAFDFVQGSNSTDRHNPFWDVVKSFIKAPTKEQKACQFPKSVLLDIGEIHRPYDWGPSVVEVQVLRVSQLFILVIPGEMTTMAGRRLKVAVREAILASGLLGKEKGEPIVQISGPASTYGHYITTEEEYSVQRYEGASTLFGPHTLEAYIDVFSRRLIPALAKGANPLPQGPWKNVDLGKSYQLKTGVVYDNAPLGHKFGDVLVQPAMSYPIPGRDDVVAAAAAAESADSSPSSSTFSTILKGSSTLYRSSSSNVTATFVGANPRNDLRLEGSYFEVQRYVDGGKWEVVRTDGHHSTTMRWRRTNGLTGSSVVEVAWSIEPYTIPGLYRIVYRGNRKAPFSGKVVEFEATTSEFYVV